jgi:hypothetical protein
LSIGFSDIEPILADDEKHCEDGCIREQNLLFGYIRPIILEISATHAGFSRIMP